MFQPSYWCGSNRKYDYQNNGDGTTHSQFFERDPSGAEVGISIRHLKKVSTLQHSEIGKFPFSIYL